LRTDFAVDSERDVIVVIPDMAGVTGAEVGRYAAQLSQLPDVSAASAPMGGFVNGAPAGPPAAAIGINGGSAFLTVQSTAPLFSQASQTQLDRMHAVSPPAGRHVDMTGTAQINRDSSSAVTSRLPTVLCDRR
jgi:putative drug exporter of the RND superfamily